MRHHFTFRSNYRAVSDYAVYDCDTGQERRLSMDTETGAARFVGASVPQDVIDDFNAWRLAGYQRDIAAISAKYGEAAAADCRPFRPAIAA